MKTKNKSLWKIPNPIKCPQLEKDIKTDVLIVGGGITGLSVLYHLQKSGISSTLVERNTCGNGVTSKSTAKITFLQDNTIMNISNFTTEEKARAYIASQVHATEHLADIIRDELIDCDLKRVDSYLFTNTDKGLSKLSELCELLRTCGVEVDECDSIPANVPVHSALAVHDTYVFHPLKFTNALVKMFSKAIYEHTKVDNIAEENGSYIATANGHRIKCKYLVLATHYPYFLCPFLFPLKSHVEVSYLGASHVDTFKPFSAINIDKPTISMRYHSDGKDDYLIYLQGSHTSCNVGSIHENFETLANIRDFDYLWSNNDIVSADYMPYIGRLEKNKPNFLIATGYNTWGMTNGALAGEIIKDAITGFANPYAELFDPCRALNLSKILRFPIDISSSAKAYIVSNANNENNSRVEYTKIAGRDVAIYTDEDGVEHIVKNRCPHMKCGLVLNETEKTWDCLCHGSRFTLDGHVLEGPVNYDITFDQN